LEFANGNDSHLQAAPTGKPFRAYLAEPEHPSGAAAVVVIQEWWGSTIKSAVSPTVWQARATSRSCPTSTAVNRRVEAEEAHHLMSDLNFGDAASQDVPGAVQFLKTRGGKVGVTGFCMGGALTLLATCAAPEIDAAWSVRLPAAGIH